jgi:hypothetical protein
MQGIAAALDRGDRSIDQLIEDLRGPLASVPALQLLADLSFHHLAGDRDAYREYEAEPMVLGPLERAPCRNAPTRHDIDVRRH